MTCGSPITEAVAKNMLIDTLWSIASQNETCSGNCLAEQFERRRGSITIEQKLPPRGSWDCHRRLAMQVGLPRRLAARSDDADLPPEGVQQYLPSRAAARPLALEYLWPVPNESCCGDNRQDSFLRSFADALLPTRSHGPSSDVEWIRSVSPHTPAAR